MRKKILFGITLALLSMALFAQQTYDYPIRPGNAKEAVVAVALRHIGMLEWGIPCTYTYPDLYNDFGDYFRNKSNKSKNGINKIKTANCWEMVLLMAIKARVLREQKVFDMYSKLGFHESPDTPVQNYFQVSPDLGDNPPYWWERGYGFNDAIEPEMGDIVFLENDNTGATMSHVALYYRRCPICKEHLLISLEKNPQLTIIETDIGIDKNSVRIISINDWIGEKPDTKAAYVRTPPWENRKIKRWLRLVSLEPHYLPCNQYGMIYAETDPVEIQGQKDLEKLFDGDGEWPNTAVIHYVVDADVAVVVEFPGPTRLRGFSISVAGTDGCSSLHVWKVEGGYRRKRGPNVGEFVATQILVDGFESDNEGFVDVEFDLPASTRVYRITVDRQNFDGIVHLLEVRPLFD